MSLAKLKWDTSIEHELRHLPRMKRRHHTYEVTHRRKHLKAAPGREEEDTILKLREQLGCKDCYTSTGMQARSTKRDQKSLRIPRHTGRHQSPWWYQTVMVSLRSCPSSLGLKERSPIFCALCARLVMEGVVVPQLYMPPGLWTN